MEVCNSELEKWSERTLSARISVRFSSDSLSFEKLQSAISSSRDRLPYSSLPVGDATMETTASQPSQ